MSTIARICRRALEIYIDDPWRWLRETDLVAYLVNDMLDVVSLRTFEPEKIKGLRERSKLIQPELMPPIPRVRTEVKLKADGLKADSKKIDICLLKRNAKQLYVGNYGIRDVVLLVNCEDIEELLEVKLDPHELQPMRKGHPTASWVNDLVKLSELQSGHSLKIPLHLLSVDTSLPIDSITGGRFGKSQKRRNNKKSRTTLQICWPLRASGVQHIREYRGKWTITLTPQDQSLKMRVRDGIYLWAIGAKEKKCKSMKAKFKNIVDPVKWRINRTDWVAACWKVSVRRT